MTLIPSNIEIDFEDANLWDTLDKRRGAKAGGGTRMSDEGTRKKESKGILSRIFGRRIEVVHEGSLEDMDMDWVDSDPPRIHVPSSYLQVPSMAYSNASRTPSSLSTSASPRKMNTNFRNKNGIKSSPAACRIHMEKHPRSVNRNTTSSTLRRKTSTMTIGKPHMLSSSLEMDDTGAGPRGHAHKKTNSVTISKIDLDAIIPSSPSTSEGRSTINTPSSLSTSGMSSSSSSKMRRTLSHKSTRLSITTSSVHHDRKNVLAQFVDGQRASVSVSKDEDDLYTDTEEEYVDCSDSDVDEDGTDHVGIGGSYDLVMERK